MASDRGRGKSVTLERREFLRRSGVGLAALLLGGSAAWAEPREPRFGVDVCPYCNMTVVDLRFTAQLVTPTGLVHQYDAIECLADHLAGHGPPAPQVAELYLADRAASARESAAFLAADDATLLHHPRLRTPMGGGLAAFAAVEAAEAFAAAQRLSGASLLTWREVVARAQDAPWVPDY